MRTSPIPSPSTCIPWCWIEFFSSWNTKCNSVLLSIAYSNQLVNLEYYITYQEALNKMHKITSFRYHQLHVYHGEHENRRITMHCSTIDLLTLKWVLKSPLETVNMEHVWKILRIFSSNTDAIWELNKWYFVFTVSNNMCELWQEIGGQHLSLIWWINRLPS